MFGDTKNKPLRLNDLLDFHLSERCDNIQSLFPTPLATFGAFIRLPPFQISSGKIFVKLCWLPKRDDRAISDTEIRL